MFSELQQLMTKFAYILIICITFICLFRVYVCVFGHTLTPVWKQE